MLTLVKLTFMAWYEHNFFDTIYSVISHGTILTWHQKALPSSDWKNMWNKSLNDKPFQGDQDKIWEVLISSSVSVIVVESVLLPLMMVGWGHFTGEMKRSVFKLVLPLLGSNAAGVALKVSASDDDLHLFDPLCMWFSQYFCWGIVALLHCHLLPSVLLHLCGSSAMTPRSSQTLLEA